MTGYDIPAMLEKIAALQREVEYLRERNAVMTEAMTPEDRREAVRIESRRELENLVLMEYRGIELTYEQRRKIRENRTVKAFGPKDVRKVRKDK